MVISWFINNPQSPSDLCEGDRLSLISCIYRSIQNASEGEEDAFTSTPLAEPKLDRRKGNIPPHAAIFQELSDQSSKDAAASVLVALHACLAIEDWTLLLPHVWRLADGPESSKKSVSLEADMNEERAETFSDDVSRHEMRRNYPFPAATSHQLRTHEVGFPA